MRETHRAFGASIVWTASLVLCLAAPGCSGGARTSDVTPAAAVRAYAMQAAETRAPTYTIVLDDTSTHPLLIEQVLVDGERRTRFSTAGRAAVLNLESETVNDAEIAVLENGVLRTERAVSQHYAYSFLLENGSVWLLPDGTLEAGSGDLFIHSTLVHTSPSPSAPAPSNRLLLLGLVPLVKKGAVGGGSSLTTYAVLCNDSDRIRMVLQEEAGDHAIWMQPSGQPSQREWTQTVGQVVEHRTATPRPSPARPSEPEEAARTARLRAAATRLGVP